MADYSQPPQEFLRQSREQGYLGIHFEQGVPILDRDLNLLHDLIAATTREVFTRYIGNGNAARDDGFAICALPGDGGENEQDFLIKKGACLVEGIECALPGDITYQRQKLKGLTTPTTGSRTDCVYLDVTLEEVDGLGEPDLLNTYDIGIQTSVRIRPLLLVRVLEGSDKVPDEVVDGHSYHPLALLRRSVGRDIIEPSDITDLRQRRLTVADMENRLSVMERILAIPEFSKGRIPEFSPISGSIGKQVTLNGSKFDRGNVAVFFGEVQADIVGVPEPTKIVTLVPVGLTSAGEENVQVKLFVRNEIGGSESETPFTVSGAPVFATPGSQFNPDHGIPTDLIDIHGFNLNVGDVEVRFGETLADQVTVASATLIKARVPDGLVPTGATSAPVTITVSTGVDSVTSNDRFTAELPIPAPAFNKMPFAPPSGEAGRSVVHLFGANFHTGDLKVFFVADTLETPAPGAVSSAHGESVTVRVPEGLTLGPQKIKVQTAGGSVTSTDDFTVTA